MEIPGKAGRFIVSLALAAGLFFAQGVFADSTYTVKKGDTLYSISRRYELTVAELRAANNLSENDVLKEGARLVIPSADISNAAALSGSGAGAPPPESGVSTKSYVVQKGDTLYGIARKFDMKLPELLALNRMGTDGTLKAGQTLLVPAGAGTSSAKSASPAPKSAPAPSPAAEPASAVSSVQWPLSSPKVKYLNGKVSGVELSGRGNEPVKSVRSGTVMYTGVYRGFGEVVFVQSKTGSIYAYSGLGSVKVKKGEYVVSGGEIGTTGSGDASSIKFMVFQNGMPVDPAKAPRG